MGCASSDSDKSVSESRGKHGGARIAGRLGMAWPGGWALREARRSSSIPGPGTPSEPDSDFESDGPAAWGRLRLGSPSEAGTALYSTPVGTPIRVMGQSWPSFPHPARALQPPGANVAPGTPSRWLRARARAITYRAHSRACRHTSAAAAAPGVARSPRADPSPVAARMVYRPADRRPGPARRPLASHRYWQLDCSEARPTWSPACHSGAAATPGGKSELRP